VSSLNFEDQQLVDNIRQVWRESLTEQLSPLRQQVGDLVRRSSRMPGSGETTALTAPRTSALTISPGEGIHASAAFADWLKQPKSHQSHFELACRYEVKAAPITGINVPVPVPMAILGPPQPQLRLGQAIPRTPVEGGSSVAFTRESSYAPGADLVAEGGLKPATALTFTNQNVPFEVIATTTKASLQSIADLPTLMSWLEQRLSYAVLLREENYLLNDAQGLLALAQPLSAAFTPPAGATTLDLIGSAISQLESAGYAPDTIVLNGADLNATRLLKSTTNEFLWASPDSAIGTNSMWGTRVVVSANCPAGTFLVAALVQAAVVFQREFLAVMVAFQNEDDFIHNLCCLRAEERVAISVLLPAGLVKGTVAASTVTAQTAHQHAPASQMKK
jgi:HK97 family phage major capsid protein